MTPCPSCNTLLPPDARFCPSCGTPLRATSTPTETSAPSAFPTAHPPPDPARNHETRTSHPSLDHSRFVPGAVLDSRYRIVALLGRGGMGEVYRAEDLKLGQTVALKFLPRGLEQDAQRLNRFLEEVRTARQVTHANVCRVYDIGEVPAAGSGPAQHYLTMEYVDGEDLASLLRRIGRLPRDKALQIARQICAGLGAAHEQGILHRDLKPANVMIDGSGRAKITDFGLAGLEASFAEGEIRSGTPAYMAPEQLAGEEVTVRSDVYALGLVLYELFTGKPAFEAESRTELIRLRRDSTPTSPSGHVEGFDPSVERVILRCLEADPRDRPASALAVSAALPGGDPLAAALAAGETPSPDMVADAGVEGALRPPVAVLCLVLALVGIASLPFIVERLTLLGRAPIELPPDVLSMKAAEIVELAGYAEPPADRAIGFEYDLNHYLYEKKREPARQWKDLGRVRPSPASFFHRQSPRLLTPLGASMPGRVTWSDPAPVVPGMIGVRLDGEGRLLRFEAVPPEVDETAEAHAPFDWSELLARADIDVETFTEVEPRWNPLAGDARTAWEGTFEGQPDVPIRVEVAEYRGRPISFRIVSPWTVRPDAEPARSTPGETATNWILSIVSIGLLLGALALARRNLRRGRADLRGGKLVAAIVFGSSILYWLLTADHQAGTGEIYFFFHQTAWSLLFAGLAWVVYISIEPHARRLLPEIMIGWSRLLRGRFKDPLVGRDVLVGILFGVVSAAPFLAVVVLAELLFQQSVTPLGTSLEGLVSTRHAVGQLGVLVLAVLIALVAHVFLLLLLLLILRRRSLAIAGFVLLTALFMNPFGANVWMLTVPLALILAGIQALVLIRFGMLATASMIAVSNLNFIVLTSDLSSWYAGRSTLILLLTAALAVYAFYVSLAGRPLFDLERAEG